MAPRFPTSWVDQVYAESNIVDLVSSYLPLQKKGKRHWGLCPFHNEKTASFSVNPELNLYYCFGCKASGNIAQFAMEMEKLTYPEALLHLAKRFNLPPPPVMEEDPLEEQRRNLRERLIEATREAAQYYHDLLWLPQHSAALDYLHNRGLDDTVIRRFGLGVSPDEWDSLIHHLQTKGYTPEEMQQAGLITVRENSRYDTFRDRIMFPIINRYGQPIGFGARAIGSGQPKYLNTADSPIFNKRNNIYGINLLRRARNLEQLILVEGYLDVIALSQAGIPNAVATLGTALTNEQVRLIKNYAPEIWIAYDGDNPGLAAALRALDVLDAEAVRGRVLAIPNGQDPDDYVLQHGAEGFLALKPMQAMAFRLQMLESEYDFGQDEGKRQFAMAACKLLQVIREPVEMDYYLGRIALKTGIAKEVLAQQVQQGRPGQATTMAPAFSQEKRPRGLATQDRSEFTLAALLATGKLPPDLVKAEDFQDEALRAVVLSLLDGKSPAHIMEESEDEASRILAGEIFNHLPDLDRDGVLQAAEDCLQSLRLSKLNARIAALSRELSTQEGEQKALTLRMITELRSELNRQAPPMVY